MKRWCSDFSNHLSVCPIQAAAAQDARVCVHPVHSSSPVVEVHQHGTSHARRELLLAAAVQVDPEKDVSEANEQIRLGIFTQNRIRVTSLIILTVTYIYINIALHLQMRWQIIPNCWVNKACLMINIITFFKTL